MNEISNTGGDSSESRRSRIAEFEKPAKAGWLATVLGTLVFITGLAVCGICGVGFFMFRPTIHTEPEKVQPLTDEMLRISVPDVFEPRGSVTWDFFYAAMMRGSYYELTGDDGILMLIEVNSDLMEKEDVHEHVIETLRREGGGGAPLVIEQSQTESKLFDVRGRKVPFRFQVGEDPNIHRKYHLVEGVVDGNTGPVMIAFRVTDEWWQLHSPKIDETILSVK